ncbi:hypothetical protein K1719_008405 [Acacia pycnantha]|nr:hypothetical protein K1719_008405 [Acacia pycnantha]
MGPTSGWEGTAHDARVFRNAIETPAMNFPHPPEGKYYLVDTGYPTPVGYIGPYKLGVVSLAMMCGGDGVADIIGRRFECVKIPYNKKKSLAGSISMLVFGSLISIGRLYYYSVLGYMELDWGRTVQSGEAGEQQSEEAVLEDHNGPKDPIDEDSIAEEDVGVAKGRLRLSSLQLLWPPPVASRSATTSAFQFEDEEINYGLGKMFQFIKKLNTYHAFLRYDPLERILKETRRRGNDNGTTLEGMVELTISCYIKI